MSPLKTMHHIAAFYKFHPVENVPDVVEKTRAYCTKNAILGTLLIAPEGVNATVSAGGKTQLQGLLSFLAQTFGLAPMAAKFSAADEPPFRRLKVRAKAEIVAMGIPSVDPGGKTGIEADPELWNQVIADPDTIVIDTRNAYEISVGSFPGAIDPKTATFRDFPRFVAEQLTPHQAHQGRKKIAMFCTGGIRCEKASSYLMDQGFDEVYQLKGGVLGYFEQSKTRGVENKWAGDCFVFDERVAVSKDLKPSGHQMCPVCRHPLSQADLDDPRTTMGASCLHCYGSRSDKSVESAQERYRQVLLAKDRGFVHLSPNLRDPHQDE